MAHLTVVSHDHGTPPVRAALHAQPIRFHETRTIDVTVSDTRLLATSLRTWIPEFNLNDVADIEDPDDLLDLISLATHNGMPITECAGLAVQRAQACDEVTTLDWFTLANEEIEHGLGDSPHAAFRTLRIANPKTITTTYGEPLVLSATDSAALYVAALGLWRHASAHATTWRSQPESATIVAALSDDAATFVRDGEGDGYGIFVEAFHSIWSRLEHNTYPVPRTLAEVAAIELCARTALHGLFEDDDADQMPLLDVWPDMAELLNFLHPIDSAAGTPGDGLIDSQLHWGVEDGFYACYWPYASADTASLSFWTEPVDAETDWDPPTAV